MNWELTFNILSVLFLVFLVLVIFKNKKNLEIQGPVILWRSKFGLKFIDKTGRLMKKNKIFLYSFTYFMLFISFLSLFYISYYLINHTYKLLITKETNTPAVSLIIPGITHFGGFSIPFWTILIIFLVALVHEFGHGIFARAWNMKVKNTGLALFLVIPGAFVELDEKELEKRPIIQKLSVLTAGPFFNIILAAIALLLIKAVSLINITYYGVNFLSVDNKNLTNGTLLMINKEPLVYSNIYELSQKIENEIANKSKVFVLYKDQNGNLIGKYVNTIKKNNSTMLGINVYASCELSNNPSLCEFKNFLEKFLLFLFLFNLGIGLANLLPLIPLDGGKILYFLIGRFKPVFILINVLILVLILLNLFYPLYSKFI